METFGDRRLGTHLLGGLDLLLPQLFPNEQLEQSQVKLLLNAMPAQRPRERNINLPTSSPYGIVETSALVTDVVLSNNIERGLSFEKPLFVFFFI